jgi:transcriptional regulator GlxA family with amidase domain
MTVASGLDKIRCRRVAILIFDEVEVLDFAGPFEVFGVARLPGGAPAFEVAVFSLGGGVVRARNGLLVCADIAIERAIGADVLVVPGGYGTRALLRLLQFILDASTAAEATLSVCTGALLLASAGLLHGRAATTHIDALDELRALDPSMDVRGNARVVDNGRILTFAGISAGIDAALYLVARLAGLDIASETARYMQYDWRFPVADGVNVVVAGVPPRSPISG